MTSYDDDALLERLGAALAEETPEPTLSEILAFERALETSYPLAVPPRPAPSWSLRRRVAAMVGAVVLVASTSTALAVGGGASLPDPFRGPVRSVGIQVDSTALAHARHALADLRDALAVHDIDALKLAAADARARIAALSAADEAQVHEDAVALLTEADRVLAAAATPERDDGGGSSGPGPNSGPGSGTSGEGGDDGGGGNPGPGGGGGDSGSGSSGSSGSGSGTSSGSGSGSSGSGSGTSSGSGSGTSSGSGSGTSGGSGSGTSSQGGSGSD